MDKPKIQEKEETTQEKNVSEVYESPKGFHRHKCESCGHVWEHGNECRNNFAAHICACGNVESYHYTGPERPTTQKTER